MTAELGSRLTGWRGGSAATGSEPRKNMVEYGIDLSYCVSDLIDALLMAWDRMDDRINVFNGGGDTRCAVRRMAEIVVEESGLDARIDYTGGDRGWVGDVPSVEYDTTKIRSLGW